MAADTRDSASAGRAQRLALRTAREPLVQFVAIALVLFGANQLINGNELQRSGESITISQGRVQQIADSYRLLAGRLPSRAELQALVNDFADEEIAYREAVAMGLDADDTIVRRRMRQKLEFLAEDAEAIAEPTDAQLTAWLNEHAAAYRLPERISFRQVMASSDTHGTHARTKAQALLDKLRSGADPMPLGDASMLPSAVALTTEQGVAMLFGEAFAATVFTHTNEGWFGPIASPLGAHAVLILSRDRARDPAFEEIRNKLRSDWIEARRRAKREAFHARLRERYEVAIEWPEIYATPRVARETPKLGRRANAVAAVGD
jgi:hypothetical protein